MSLPLVSVAIPAYNHAAYIEDCLASVCAQTYPELELVLIDDGSRDHTFELAERFLANHAGRFRRVHLQRQTNQGVSATSNACIQACQAEWVHLLGSDDRLYPDKIAHIQQAIADWACPDLALVHADVDFIDQHNQPVLRPSRLPPAPSGVDYQAYRWLFNGTHYVFNPTLALRREAILAIGGFDPQLPLEDLDGWLRLSTRYALARLPEVVASYRKHPGNATRQRGKMLAAQLLTFAKFLDEQPDLIEADVVRSHFRLYLRRFWRRIRKQQPWQIGHVLGAALHSVRHTPRAEDYRRLAERLQRAAR